MTRREMTREEALRALAESRKNIDELDVKLLELLNQRTRVVEAIGQAKESLGMPIYEPRREEDVFRNVTGHNHGPLTADAVKSIFERIIDEMRTLQKMRRQQKQSEGEKEC
jgi:chorismate mutase